MIELKVRRVPYVEEPDWHGWKDIYHFNREDSEILKNLLIEKFGEFEAGAGVSKNRFERQLFAFFFPRKFDRALCVGC